MTFTKPWRIIGSSEGKEIWGPLLDIFLSTVAGREIRETFFVDSGADRSMAPRRICDLLGLAWEKGKPVQLQGISPREECTVAATIHPVEIHIREVACRITIPICFAEGDAPFLLGRDGFFDAFRITFDKRNLLTLFELQSV